MGFLKVIVKDVLYISKVTGTQNKKILITTSVVFSQLVVFTDVFLIGLFAYLIADQKTNIEIVDSIAAYFGENKILILFVVLFRFLWLFLQSYILRRIEFTVTNNLKEFILSHIFEKRTYSVSDAFYYTNDISGHIGYFYSNFAAFLNNTLSIFAYCIYLVSSNLEVLSIFGVGLLCLYFPIKKIIKITRDYVDKTYFAARDSMSEIERVIENLFLIKILKKEKAELNKFSETLSLLKSFQLNKHNFQILNGYLPSFVTLVILSVVIIFFSGIKLTLDFIGVTLKLFNAVSAVTVTFSNIINSHVHISKFKELKFDSKDEYRKNFVLKDVDFVKFDNVVFKYENSIENIFEGLDLKFEKGKHTILTGENGTGKSTLLGLVAGIYYPQKGKVITYSNKFGYVSAQPYIFRDTLLNNIMYGNEDLEISNETILDMLKEFNTFKNESEYALDRDVSNKSLSSGQMQKIGFIRSLLSNPDIILLDESTSNLDTDSKNIVFEKLKNSKSTVINSTHDPKNFDFVDHHYEISIVEENRKVNKLF